MAQTAATTTHFAISADGTQIAYERVGDGPAVILVEGALGFRSFSSSRQLAGLLAGGLTVYCFDRRGRGESSDTQPYALEREIEDIDAIIDIAGGTASLYGISSGGALALEAAAALGDRVERLAVYEIPYDSTTDGIRAWHEYRRTLTQLLASGQRGAAVELFMRFVGAPAEMIDGARQSPMWATFESVAPTLAYDAAALGADRTPPLERAANVSARALVMDGGASLEHMPFMRASAEALTRAIPKATHHVVEGQTHAVESEAIAPVLADFLLADR